MLYIVCPLGRVTCPRTFEVRDDADTQKNVALASVATCGAFGAATGCGRPRESVAVTDTSHAITQHHVRAPLVSSRRTAFASMVFPVPGGPKSKSPRGGARSPCAG